MYIRIKVAAQHPDTDVPHVRRTRPREGVRLPATPAEPRRGARPQHRPWPRDAKGLENQCPATRVHAPQVPAAASFRPMQLIQHVYTCIYMSLHSVKEATDFGDRGFSKVCLPIEFTRRLPARTDFTHRQCPQTVPVGARRLSSLPIPGLCLAMRRSGNPRVRRRREGSGGHVRQPQ